MPNGLAIPGGVTFPILAPDGSEAAPSYSFQSAPSSGLFAFSAGRVTIAVAGSTALAFQTAGAAVVRGLAFSPNPINVTEDLYLNRLAAASLGLGGSPSATPVAQTFTIGEASRPGTDTNVGGASGTIRSGLGTGTGTASSLLFQTPTLAASGTGAQAYATRLTIATADITAAVQLKVLDTAGIAFATATTIGYLATAANIGGAFFSSAVESLRTVGQVVSGIWNSPNWGPICNNVSGVTGFTMRSGDAVTWSSDAFNSLGGPQDLSVARLAAASLRQGAAPSSTPVNQTFTIGEASRGGTDLNVAGANGTIRSGLGTGNAPGSSLLFQTPDVGASGTVAQTYATRLTINAQNTTFDLPNQGLRINGQTSGAGVSVGTLTNAPSAGDPSFWLPISIAGNIRYIPCWT